jgi:hypothetical protein
MPRVEAILGVTYLSSDSDRISSDILMDFSLISYTALPIIQELLHPMTLREPDCRVTYS